MKKILLLLSVTGLLFSCSSEKSNSAGGKFLTAKVVDKILAEKFIFNMDSVYKAMDKVNSDQVAKGKQLFMQGLDHYINQKNPASAAQLFRESVQYYPDFKTYNYLANAYIDIMDTVHADSALLYDGMGDYESNYTMARLAAVKKDSAAAISYLGSAFEEGFTNKKRFEKDKVFDYLRNERGFISLIVTYLKNDDKLKEMLFKSFIASAPVLNLPFAMPKDSICETDLQTMYSKPSINYDFSAFISGMEDSRFSRDVSNMYFMVGRFEAANNMQVVLYKKAIVMIDTLPPIEIKLATFDSLGNLIEEITFAQFELPETLLTATVDENKIITVKENKMKWKNNPLDEGYRGNEYMGEDFVSETKYEIDATGHIVPYNDKNVVKK